jgi:hypothetical protein
MLGVADSGPDLGELLDRVSDLLVQDAPVGDHDDRVEDPRVRALEPDELMGEPGDRVGLAAAGGVLDQVAPADLLLPDRGKQLPHDVELVEPRPDLHRALSPGLLILDLDDLGVVLQDVGEALPG